MNDSFDPNVVTIYAGPFVYESMETVRNIIAEFFASGGGIPFLTQVLAIVVAELEYQALIARLTSCTHVLQGKLSAADALQRACELRELPLS